MGAARLSNVSFGRLRVSSSRFMQPTRGIMWPQIPNDSCLGALRTISKPRFMSVSPMSRDAKRKKQRDRYKLGDQSSVAFLVDADKISFNAIDYFLEQIRNRGRLVHSLVFVEPGRIQNTSWREFITTRKMKFRAVPREVELIRDPNDIALQREARLFLQSGSIDVFVLVARDKDYLPLVRDIVSGGKTCVVCFSKHHPGLMRQFANAGADTLVLANPDYNMYLPKFAAVLHADGSGSITKDVPEYMKESAQDDGYMDILISKLHASGYIAKPCDPTLPAIAKFWFSNDQILVSHPDLIVYPAGFAIRSIGQLLQDQPDIGSTHYTGDLAFIFPMSSNEPSTRTAIAEFGSPQCAARVRGGGPFILKDSATLGEEILSRMKFIDDRDNTSVDEAVDVFLRGTKTRTSFRKVGVSIDPTDTTQDRLDKIRLVSLSRCFPGTFQIPPGDRSARDQLAAKGLIKRSSSQSEVLSALQDIVKGRGIQPKTTYHGLLTQWQDIFTGRSRDPSRRL